MKYIPWNLHEKIFAQFKNGGQKLKPLWHLNKTDIDFEKTNLSLHNCSDSIEEFLDSL